MKLFQRRESKAARASGGSMPRRKPNPDSVTVKLGPAAHSMDGGETWEEGGPLDYLRRRAGLATSPPHACEDWRDMCDDCRTEFEAWKAAKK